MSDPCVVGVQLDLKYLMPSKAYLQRWVAQLPELGVNTLLLEYEDKFPFQRHPFLKVQDAFTVAELTSLLDTARGVGLRVVPLVQSVSHLEFALRHEQLAHLREAPHIHTQLNTADPRSVEFVCGLIDEVLEFHEADEWLHLGADECWRLGSNPDSAEQLERLGPVGVWAEHLGPILDHVISRGKRPLLWDDIFWRYPQAIHDVELPKQTLLVSWDYGSRFGEDHWKQPGEGLRRIEVYRDAGYEVLTAPCLNWGVMAPRFDHCLQNTAACGDAARRAGTLGVLNTAWASFHVLPHAQAMHIAATAAAMQDPELPLSIDWQAQWLRDYFGIDDKTAQSIPDAWRTVSELWEIQIDGLKRPLTPLVYGYMDILLRFDSLSQREELGAIPTDWSQIDFHEIQRIKLQRFAELPEPNPVVHGLHDRLPKLRVALDAFALLQTSATSHCDEARYFAWAAEMKYTHGRILLQTMAGDERSPELAAEWDRLCDRFEAVMSPFAEPSCLQRLCRAWCEPTLRHLRADLATA